MKKDNLFDIRIGAKKMPEHFRDAAIELTDTLDLCWAAAQAVFETEAKPEHALALLPQFMARADEKNRQLLAQFGRGTDGESLLPPAPR
jgi:hypothetical protein